MNAFATTLFWTSAALVAYAYVGYPVLLCAVAKLFGTRTTPGSTPLGETPPKVSILVAAHDEEDVIAPRVRNALSADYPAERLEVVIASDGSTDGTARAVRAFADSRVILLHSPIRRGKAATLADAVRQVSGDLLVLSDANTHFDPGAIRSLVRWFTDPKVGIVCGRLILTDSASGRNLDGAYWKYETFLKTQESRLGALLGANGAIYAIRRDLFPPIPADTMVDDFVIPLMAKLQSRCDIVYDRDAVAREETAPDIRGEFRRRVRIGAGGWQAIVRLRRLLDPRRGWVAFTFLSHKILRWIAPFGLIGMIAANLILLRTPRYQWIFAAQAVGYGIALAGWVLPARVPFSRPMRLATLFIAMNAALFVGFLKWMRGGQAGIWARTRRDGAESTPQSAMESLT